MPDNQTSLELIRDLFKLIKRFPHIKFKHSVIQDLSRSEYELLILLRTNLDEQKPSISVSEISSLLQITPAGVTHLINPLEAKGFIERLADRSDRRIVLVGLTSKGTETADTMLAIIQEQLLGLTNHLGKEDSRAFFHLMTRAIEYLSGQLV